MNVTHCPEIGSVHIAGQEMSLKPPREKKKEKKRGSGGGGVDDGKKVYLPDIYLSCLSHVNKSDKCLLPPMRKTKRWRGWGFV